MTAVDLPEEPPVGTILTAPEARHLWVRDDEGWRVTNIYGVRSAPGAPPGRWDVVVWNLTELGGILTVTTEYQVEYRWEDPSDKPRRGRQLQNGFRSREHVRSWADHMDRTSAAVRILAVRSQRVTRSAWTDEPLKDPS